MLHVKDMSDYRLEQAEQCLASAEMLFDAGDFKGAANRSYYCVFHAIRSMLALENVDFSSHAAVIAYFRKNYIKTNKLQVGLSDILGELFTVRNKCDYDDFYVISKSEVRRQLESAKFFIDEVRIFLGGDSS